MIAKDYLYQTVTVNGLYKLYKEEIDNILYTQFKFEDLEGKGDYRKLNAILAFFSLYYLNLESLANNNDLFIDYDKLVECCSQVQFKDWIFNQECVGSYNEGYDEGYNSMLANAYTSAYDSGYSVGQLKCDVSVSKNPYVNMQKKVTDYC